MSIFKHCLKVATLIVILYLILNAPEILRGAHDFGDLPQWLWRLAIGSAVGLSLFIGASVDERHPQP